MLINIKDYIRGYSNYIKESFEDKQIPNIIKKMSYDIRKDITSNGNNSFQKNYTFGDYLFNINVIYTNGIKTPYYSSINIYNILTNPDEPVIIKVDVKDNIIDINYLMSIISHEIRHVYDIYTISHETEFNSFTKTLNLNKYYNTKFSYFVDLVYLSLEHELIARNNMLYELYRWVGITDKKELLKLFKTTYVNETLKKLKHFNTDNFISQFTTNELQIFITNFTEDINDDSYNGDIVKYFNNWGTYFKNKSTEFYKHVDNMLNDIIEDIKNDKIYERLIGFISYNENILGGVSETIFKSLLLEKNNDLN